MLTGGFYTAVIITGGFYMLVTLYLIEIVTNIWKRSFDLFMHFEEKCTLDEICLLVVRRRKYFVTCFY